MELAINKTENESKKTKEMHLSDKRRMLEKHTLKNVGGLWQNKPFVYDIRERNNRKWKTVKIYIFSLRVAFF